MESLKRLSWEELERFTALILDAYSFDDVKPTSLRGEKGIDGGSPVRLGHVEDVVAVEDVAEL